MTLLSVTDLSVRFSDALAVDGLSLQIESGEALGLVGESGSGKTQTALALMGLSPSNAIVTGSVRIDGNEIIDVDESAIRPLRAVRVGMVFQDPADALNPCLRIGDQLARILISHGLADAAAARRSAIEALARVGLPDPERQSRAWPHQLSGGMRQRAMIAAALIAKPDLLIADEPTTALDVTVQAQILALLDDIREDTALLLITHDMGVVAGHCQRMIVLDGGKPVEEGPVEAVYSAPEHPRTQALLAATRLKAAPPPLTDSVPALQAEQTTVAYGRRNRLEAVKSADLVVNIGETVAIVGESGCGKSTLAAALTGLVVPEAGRVVFMGQPLAADITDRPAAVRKGMQLIFQDPAGSLNPQMRVRDIVAEPLRVHAPGLSTTERRASVSAALADMGLDEQLEDRFPHELSGGQAQRVAIARALVLEPQVMVCDEAVAALDGTVRERILDALQAVQKKTGLSIVFISHDLGVVRAISHRVAVMYLGSFVEVGETSALFDAPRHPYTKALLDAVPIADPAAERPMVILGGEVPSPLSPPAGCAFHPRCAYAVDRCRSEEPEQRDVGGRQVACHRSEELEL